MTLRRLNQKKKGLEETKKKVGRDMVAHQCHSIFGLSAKVKKKKKKKGSHKVPFKKTMSMAQEYLSS